MKKITFRLAVFIFFLPAGAHFLGAVFGMRLVLGNRDVPRWASWFVVIVSVLIAWSFRYVRRK